MVFCYTCPGLTTLPQETPIHTRRGVGSPRLGWALLLLALLAAALLRFWALDAAPPGLYRDEAYNGLDALRVLEGEHALFFPANNGREPAYIYLTAAAVALLGRTAPAVRLAAAVAGTLTTLIVYGLGRAWFGERSGLLAAWLWAITLWPVHLSRVGLRPILLVPLLGLTFWLGTIAYRRRRPGWWMAAGIAYGLAFYTYLAVRFTPVLLLALFVVLLLTGREKGRGLWPGLVWFALGTAVTLLPFTLLITRQPEILLGRVGQVSLLNPAVHGGDLPGTLLRQSGTALGMFLWRGDDILRHNPAGRPVFDLIMALPFLAGLLWTLRHWRRPPAQALLLWGGVMLGPTILAEDTPHFLRAVGVLPAVLFFPALGMAWGWRWLNDHGRSWWGPIALILLLSGSATFTIHDYVEYAQDVDTAYLFEAAAVELAEEIAGTGEETAVYLEQRFWSGWPSIPFLVTRPGVTRFRPDEGLPSLTPPAVVYAWPYQSLAYLPAAWPETALITARPGPPARGDLEAEAYPLYVRYSVAAPPPPETIAIMGDKLHLRQTMVNVIGDDAVQVALTWEWMGETSPPPFTVFTHLVDDNGLVAQDDAPPAGGYWPSDWQRPGLAIRDRHTIQLPEPYNPTRHRILVGVYDQAGHNRWPVRDATGKPAGDALVIVNGEW